MASIVNLENYNSDQHFTPKSIFEALNCTFDLDVCGSSLAWVPAKKVIELPENGLEAQWFGFIWMNPPYSKPTPWVEKFIYHNNGIALLPITRGRWWDSVWNSSGAIIPNEYNFKFIRPDGVKRDITFRTMLFALGDGIQILRNSGLGKMR